MALRFSITNKVIILVAIPFVFEVGFALLLNDALKRFDEESKVAEHAREISDTTNMLIKDLYMVVTEFNLGPLVQSGRIHSIDVRRVPQVQKVYSVIDKLKELTAGDKKQTRVVDGVADGLEHAIEALEIGIHAYRKGDEETFNYQRKVGVKAYLPQLISTELIDLPKDAKERQDQAVKRQIEYRGQVQNYLFGLVAFSFLITAFITLILIVGLTRRLSQLRENTIKVALNEPLPPLLGGSDEIADVDRAFHQLVRALDEAHHREKAVLDNALDMICSIDANGRISAINQASFDVLGFSPDDLLGRYYIDLVAPDDVSYVLENIDRVKEGLGSNTFEGRMVRVDGSHVFVLWSAHWSRSERSLFCVLHDISAQKAAERLRQEVISMVTHDLRTPLTAIRMAAEMIREAQQHGPETEHMLARIGTSSTRMMLLINDLLDIEKIRAGSMELSKVKVLTGDLYEQCLDTVSALVDEKEIIFDSDEEDEQELYADPDRIVQVLVNLVSNAIKFSPRRSTIKLSSRATANGVEIHVADQGRGIPAEMLGRVFDRFQQVEESDATVKGGSGLGLAICKSLVELHGGRIWVESEEGHGSTFKFSIPKA